MGLDLTQQIVPLLVKTLRVAPAMNQFAIVVVTLACSQEIVIYTRKLVGVNHYHTMPAVLMTLAMSVVSLLTRQVIV